MDKKSRQNLAPAIPPGATLYEEMYHRGWDAWNLARRLADIGPPQIDDNGYYYEGLVRLILLYEPLGVSLAQKLSAVMDVPLDFFVNLERDYRKRLEFLKGVCED